MLQSAQENFAMSRVPQAAGYVSPRPYRPEPTAADYSDDICEANLEALRAIGAKCMEEDEFELVDGPAW